MGLLDRIAHWKIVEIVLTVLVYCIYAVVVALSIAPAVWLLITVLPEILGPVVAAGGGDGLAGATALTSLKAAAALAVSLYVYTFFGAVVQAGMVRLLSLGIRSGRYPAFSLTTIRWLVYSGIYTISVRTVLPLVPVTFVTNMYFRIVGCRMGRNVKINSYMLNDAYLLTLEDDVIVGGATDISCHLFESNHLVLKPIHIGAGTLVGAHSYISPGVRIGKRCVIGLGCYIRSDRVIPDRAVVTSIAGTDVATAREIERSGRRSIRPGRTPQ